MSSDAIGSWASRPLLSTHRRLRTPSQSEREREPRLPAILVCVCFRGCSHSQCVCVCVCSPQLRASAETGSARTKRPPSGDRERVEASGCQRRTRSPVRNHPKARSPLSRSSSSSSSSGPAESSSSSPPTRFCSRTVSSSHTPSLSLYPLIIVEQVSLSIAVCKGACWAAFVAGRLPTELHYCYGRPKTTGTTGQMDLYLCA